MTTKTPQTRPHHLAIYNGKIVSMDYIGDAKAQFKYAAMRIIDNGANGFVVTTKDEVYSVTQSSRRAKPVIGDERAEVLAKLA